MIKIIRLATLALCFGTAAFAATPKTVRVIYLVSADRQENPVYTRAIADAAVSVQSFFRRELGGTTYRLNNPIVEVVKSDKEAAWFYGQARRGNVDNWGYDNTLDEVHRLLGAKHDDPDYVWVIYSDGPGSSGRGGGGVCIMPENDLLGLTGKRHNYPDPRRWIGGFGHEVGHAFGLPHTKDTKKHGNSLMWTGFYDGYPDQTYLTEDEKAVLLKNPFFFDAAGTPVAGEWQVIARYNRRDGYIVRQQHTKTGAHQWTQTVANGTSVITFNEVAENGGYFHLKRTGGTTTFELKIPVAGGASQILTREKPAWSPFENFDKVK